MLNKRFDQSIYRLIEVFQEIEAFSERNTTQLQMQIRAPPEKDKAKYVAVNEGIQRLVDDTFERGIATIQRVMKYVDSVAYQLRDVKHKPP